MHEKLFALRTLLYGLDEKFLLNKTYMLVTLDYLSASLRASDVKFVEPNFGKIDTYGVHLTETLKSEQELDEMVKMFPVLKDDVDKLREHTYLTLSKEDKQVVQDVLGLFPDKLPTTMRFLLERLVRPAPAPSGTPSRS